MLATTFSPVIVQDLLAQSARVGVQQAGQDFFFQVFIDVHAYLFMAVDRYCSSLAWANYWLAPPSEPEPPVVVFEPEPVPALSGVRVSGMFMPP